MNNEQIYAIVSQGLNIANQKGCFNLEESHQISSALIELQKVLNTKIEKLLPKPTTTRNAKVKQIKK